MRGNYLKKKKDGTSLGLSIVCALVAFIISALFCGWIITIAWNGILAGLLGAATMNYGQGVLLWMAWASIRPGDGVYTALIGDDH